MTARRWRLMAGTMLALSLLARAHPDTVGTPATSPDVMTYEAGP